MTRGIHKNYLVKANLKSGRLNIEMRMGRAQATRGTKEEPPLSRGLSRFARPRGLGLIQQQFRHLASLRNDHPGGKLLRSYFFFFLGAFFFISLFRLDLDLAAFLEALFLIPGIDTSFFGCCWKAPNLIRWALTTSIPSPLYKCVMLNARATRSIYKEILKWEHHRYRLVFSSVPATSSISVLEVKGSLLYPTRHVSLK